MLPFLGRLTAPTRITTAPAPTLAAPSEHVDVRVDDVPPCVVEADLVPADVAAPPAASAGAAHFDLSAQIGRVPPGYTPGVCWHQAHVVLNGLQFAVVPTSSDSVPNMAQLLLCHHRSRPADAAGIGAKS